MCRRVYNSYKYNIFLNFCCCGRAANWSKHKLTKRHNYRVINTDVHRTHIHTSSNGMCVCVYTHTGTHLATHATTYRISSMRVCTSVCVCCCSCCCCCCTCTYAHPQSAPRDRALQKQLCFIFFLSQQRRATR